ncbi:hypothetical protein N665_0438s0028 [Sinapis alba]|nr:hypothetical protein N665_0438s0028 [Sinapis alba]
MKKAYLFFLIFIVTLSLALAVEVGYRTSESIAEEIISSLSQAKYEDWSAAFISTDDKIRGGVLPATLFIPVAATDEHLGDRNVAAYHVVPEKMEFSDLLAKEDKTRIVTLLAGCSILVRNTTEGGLTLDGVSVTEPDIFVDKFIAIHRIRFPLDFTKYGRMVDYKPKPKTELISKLEIEVFAVVIAVTLAVIIRCLVSSRR